MRQIARLKLSVMGIVACLLSILVLAGCDNKAEYKARIQDENDRLNQAGNQAVCLSVGDITRKMYPYTIEYLEGEIDESNGWDKVRANRKTNLKLSLYAKEGLFSEELVGYDGDKPLYRYDLTDEGHQYVEFSMGGTNFCFGRVVIDNIRGIHNDGQNNFGAEMKTITYNYHMENIPDWIKNKDISSLYIQYSSLGDVAQGKSVLGNHTYSVSSDGRLSTRRAQSGRLLL